jgi:SAM-dependent methyltransferase
MSGSQESLRGPQPAGSIALDTIQPGSLIFRCNVCGNKCIAHVSQLGREIASCPYCRSTVRMRSIVYALSTSLFGQSLALPDFPFRPDIHVIGLSDWDGYAAPLASKLSYQNTFYHQDPRLDIMSIEPALENTLDVLISSEVFEHVPPPVSIVFQNSFRLLKPGGTLILTVPYLLKSAAVEHFPDLHDYKILNQNGKFVLHNTTRDGQKQIFENLVFHGGPGETLEMRIFSLNWIMSELETAGFQEIKILSTSDFEHGIFFRDHWSLPMTARKP